MSALSNPLTSDSSTGNPLENPLASSANAGQYEVGDTIETIHGEMEVTGVDELGRPQVDQYGGDLNWEDSFGPASKHLGVSEGEWQEFISGVNAIKSEMRQYEGNEARVMQTRSRGEDAQSVKRVAVLMNQGATQEEAEAEVYGSEGHAQRQEHQQEYDALNQQLNDLYESVGLDPAGAITGSGTNSPGYAVNFDLVSGDVSHSKGDAAHSMGKMAVMAAAGVVAGPAVAGALGGVLGPAAAKAASSAIINLATQYMSTGDVDWKQALVSAATSYGGAKLGNALQGSSSLGGIGDKISGVTDKFTEVLDKTGSIGSAAIKAGGMSMLTQMVTTGEIDAKQAGLAALMAAGSTGLSEFQASMESAGAELTSDDLQEIVVEAKRVGTDVGGGMTQLENGLVINDAGQIIGNMDEIDLDGDGMLSGNDLQEITTPPRDLVDPNLNDNVYGDVDLSPPGSTTNPDAFTKGWMEDRYAGMTREQMVNQMQADGFGYDPETGEFEDYAQEYLDEWDATNDLNLQELNTASYGAIDVNMEDPYTIGQTDEGTYYIAKTDELTGEVSFKAISEEQFNDLYGELYGGSGQSGAIGNGDWSGVEDYLVDQSLADGGNIITGGFDADGNPIGNTEGISVDDWVTLEEGSFNNTAVPIDDFVEADPVKQETVEEVAQDNSSSDATGDPNESVDAGQGTGGGETSSSGGTGASGATGGSGTAGGGNNGGAIVIGQAPGTPGGAGNVGSGDPNASTETETEIDPAGGEGVPATPAMNSRIEELMARGMSYEQAVANQNAAISQGADLNEDGMVTNAEWAAHTNVPGSTGEGGSTGGAGTGAGTGGTGGGTSTGGGEGSGGGAGSGTGTGSSGSGSGGSTGTGGGTGTGTGSGTGSGGGVNGGSGGGASGTTGGGEGTTPGVGTGTQPGSGGGAGGGGNGGTGGNGAGMLSGSGGSGRPEWGPLFPGTPFKKFEKRRTGIVQSLFEDLMK